jgi:hypothetical protein
MFSLTMDFIVNIASLTNDLLYPPTVSPHAESMRLPCAKYNEKQGAHTQALYNFNRTEQLTRAEIPSYGCSLWSWLASWLTIWLAGWLAGWPAGGLVSNH